MSAEQAPQTHKHVFQTEVSQLLHLMVHSVYTEKEVFLRELISNASDACDKLRYEAIAQPGLLADDARLAIRISFDKSAGTLTVADNGIGMNEQELIDNLGTIARSGTRAFLERMTAGSEGSSLIGQFGVGFYSAFMVADRIDVVSRKAGEDRAWLWVSDGASGFTVAPAPEAPDRQGEPRHQRHPRTETGCAKFHRGRRDRTHRTHLLRPHPLPYRIHRRGRQAHAR